MAAAAAAAARREPWELRAAGGGGGGPAATADAFAGGPNGRHPAPDGGALVRRGPAWGPPPAAAAAAGGAAAAGASPDAAALRGAALLPQLQRIEKMPLGEAVALRKRVQAEFGKDHGTTQLVARAVEQAALLNKEWSDMSFQWGAEENARVLAEVEEKYHRMAQESEGGLEEDPALLSAGIDMAVCYVKNVRLSKADEQYATVVPHARKRGGVWKVKALNHLVTLRMKQGRHVEAYALLKEIEGSVTATHDEARDAWTTLYRNQAMGLLGLSDFSGALLMYIKAATVSGRVTWWDRWDIGFSMSLLAYDRKDPTMLRRAVVAIQDALPLHEADEPEDRVMHSKIHHALGDAYMLLALLDPLSSTSPQPPGAEGQGEGGDEVERATALVVQPGRMAPLLTAREYYELAAEQFLICNSMMQAASGRPGDLSAGAAGSIVFCLLPLGRHAEAIPHAEHVLRHHCTASNGHRACHFLARALDHALEIRAQCGEAVFSETLGPLRELMGRLDGDPLDVALCRYKCALLLTSSGEAAYLRGGVECMRMAEPELRRRSRMPPGTDAAVMDAVLKLVEGGPPAGGPAPGREEARPLPPRRARGNDTWQALFSDMRSM
eukprot:TRINITY_DN24739_c0_g1_i2.p1 TRINITY_DN24739_c0_g1~~TRINITY_DN24739_c0_g1_i2.p1  ORF type:complete len:695 (+),score=213.39 TRINITY_DN24739_c0_g1_i2:257-2086(+)